MTDSTPQLDVLCVDDQPDICEMLRVFISREPDMNCIDCVRDAQSGLDVIERAIQKTPLSDERPFIVLMDLTMPGLDPLEATRTIAKRWPSIRVLICSAHDEETVQEASMEAGAWGIVSKHRGHHEIIASIRRVGNGEAVGLR